MSNSNVKKFYNKNTNKFLRFGKNAGTKVIHQPLWGEGVKTLEEALHFSHYLILKHIKEKNAKVVLDLGCGVGASVFYLNKNYKKECDFYGVSISEEQIKIAKDSFNNIKNCHFFAANFEKLPGEIPKADIAYAIEAFVHGTDAEAFFEQVAGKLKPGGRLILIDDMLTQKGASGKISQTQVRQLQAYRSGWMIGNLYTINQLNNLAENMNLKIIENKNLTSLMHLGRFRDKMIGLMVFLAGRWMDASPYWKNMKGGYSKQALLKTGLLEYQYIVFKKNNS